MTPEQHMAAVVAAQAEFEAADARAQEARDRRADAMIAAVEAGVPTNQIAKTLGMSWSGIQRITKGR